ncbi:MAG: hypothetical protein IPJ89_02630 [Candidatus Iainarchaeum archaeon]|uniref:Uncharacterized protein n=1 Tax=Candidatus Iainarchaeum sp. TaxID=3101447 RepID=A0A7T9I261_9ARCH|nr:MAG: hypothetical protein IPJ89_02630 [Candidatus Diapherotrites archaeon]
MLSINPLFELAIAWILGAIIGAQLFPVELQIPTLLAVIGFVLAAGIFSTFYFGKLAWVFVGLLAALQAPFVLASPLAGLLWGLCVIASAMYGKALGGFGLEDIYQQGQTRLPSMSLAALLNAALILIFATIIAFVWPVLPTLPQLIQLIPIRGFGV